MPGGVTPSSPGDPNAAGPLPLRRLGRREYNNTVRDLLGDTTRPADQFPPDRDEGFTFRRSGLVAVQDATVIRAAAESLAAAAIRKLPELLACDAAAMGETACARQFVTTFGLRAFRRPLAGPEIDRLMALYNTGRGTLRLAFPDAIGLLLEAMLQAPAFLYHWEMPPGPVTREGGVVKLSAYEVASRLSYFLWGSMPDRDLFAAAAAGRLGTPGEVEAQARRMIADPKAKETVATFFEDWLDLDALRETPKDPKLYPEYNDALRSAMLAEARSFIQGVVFDGDGRWSTMLSATFSYVNQSLGAVYGLAQARGTTLQKLDLNPAQRQGFLTHAGFLALTGATDGSHPVRRGHAIFERVLCRKLPPPPPDVPPARPPSPGLTTRERFAEHNRNECARGCHALIDPIGFAFEHYDGIGRYRTMDAGRPVDATGTLTLDGASQGFANALELSGLLARSDDARRCFTIEWLRFALLREELEADRASLDAAAAGFARADATVRDLLVALTTTRTFRYRSPSPGEVLP
jgi:hypothetical protein